MRKPKTINVFDVWNFEWKSQSGRKFQVEACNEKYKIVLHLEMDHVWFLARILWKVIKNYRDHSVNLLTQSTNAMNEGEPDK
jgi:HSP90 family molecular chaperone